MFFIYIHIVPISFIEYLRYLVYIYFYYYLYLMWNALIWNYLLKQNFIKSGIIVIIKRGVHSNGLLTQRIEMRQGKVIYIDGIRAQRLPVTPFPDHLNLHISIFGQYVVSQRFGASENKLYENI